MSVVDSSFQVKKLSTQIRAVLMIFTSSPALYEVVRPSIDLTTESIDWETIFKVTSSSCFRACAQWAYAIWTDRLPAKSNPFDGALKLEPEIQKCILRALSLRWGLNS
jgi:hypothetical protein